MSAKTQDADDREHEDCATLDDVVREVFCRLFADDGDAGAAEMERWRAWYKPSDWLWWGRGLGTFLELRVKERQAVPKHFDTAIRRAVVDAISSTVAACVNQSGIPSSAWCIDYAKITERAVSAGAERKEGQ